ncbi:membrane dipeptidase [Alkalicaulis satelles]|uniref:Membrane dipeptidase n=1 Tax=Alkalicaulis satelles TaxID=2609175 RepID=A0A5M6ZBC5_9PROT|nr:dipeptidase [Alkalicaulis satelles]KAA5801087.1 membrane dipeptidase [Alkalicaulis satelles]
MIRTCLAALAAFALMAGAAAADRQAREVSEAEARAVHARVLTLDTHIDIPRGYATHAIDPGGFTRLQNDLPKMRAGGLDAAFLIVYAGQGPLDDDGYASARATAENTYQAIMRMTRAYPDQIALARTADEVEAIHAEGRLVALIGIENGYLLGPSLDDLPLWAERGVRYVGLTHFGHNQFAGSSNPLERLGDSDEDPGLSELGRALIPALNDHGILVDVSHVGKRSMMEAVALSRAPIIASHSGASGYYENARNLDDEQLDAIRDNGGVAQMVAFRSYVADVDPRILEGITALRERYLSEGWAGASQADLIAYQDGVAGLRARYDDVTLAQFADHIDYAVARIGIEHVGISSDFDGGGGVEGWDDASETLNVTWELLRRGYSEDEIRALWGGNVLRILRAAEAAAQ